jgi:hypothetical protein
MNRNGPAIVDSRRKPLGLNTNGPAIMQKPLGLNTHRPAIVDSQWKPLGLNTNGPAILINAKTTWSEHNGKLTDKHIKYC